MNYQLIDKETCRESFKKFPPSKKRQIKKMSAELEKLIEAQLQKMFLIEENE